MGYAKDVASMVAMTIPPEFLTNEILITRLERPQSTGWLRRDVWEAAQKEKLAELERERLGFWPTIEDKWAAQDAHNHALAIAVKTGAQERRAQRKKEFEALMAKSKRVTEDAKHQKELSKEFVDEWDIYGYNA